MFGAIAATPLPILILVFSFICPTELSLYLGGLRLPPHRIALLVFLPMALTRLMGKDGPRLKSFDYLVFGYNIWTVSVFMLNDGAEEGLKFGGSLALESFGSYILARAYVRDVATAASVIGALFAAVLLAGLIALPETVLGSHYVHETLAKLTGYSHPIAYEKRLGLTRAYGTFDHPIHFGTFCASVLALVWMCERRAGKVALITSATLLGLSSAPILCLGVQGALIGWDRVTRSMKRRVAMTVGVLLALYLGASLVMTRSPLVFIATGMTLDPWTGFYRTLIWDYGLENVWAHPLTGIGLADWERPKWMAAATIDTMWLVIAVRTGVPSFLLVAGAILLIALAVAKAAAASGEKAIRRFALGWMFSLLALVLAACTVHFWNVLHAYFFFFVGLAGWVADPVRSRRRAKAPALARVRPGAIAYPRLRSPARAAALPALPPPS